MRRAMVALMWHPAEDAEVSCALHLDLEPPSAGAATRAGAKASAASAGVGGAAAPMGGAPTLIGATAWVNPDEDNLTVHEAIEFHLGGRHWFDPVPTKRPSSRLSCDDSCA
jgi:hypothetical protein